MPSRAKGATTDTGRQRPTEPLTQLSVRVPRSLQRRLRLVCVEQDREMQTFIAEALREYLDRRGFAKRAGRTGGTAKMTR
jgi:predicted transcriptional regulator